MYKIKNPMNISLNNIKKFFINLGLEEMVNQSVSRDLSVNEMKVDNPYKPDLKDLYRLSQTFMDCEMCKDSNGF